MGLGRTVAVTSMLNVLTEKGKQNPKRWREMSEKFEWVQINQNGGSRNIQFHTLFKTIYFPFESKGNEIRLLTNSRQKQNPGGN